MANMKHCRFENTYIDLKECLEALENEGGITGVEQESDGCEKPYIKKLVELCIEIAANYEDEL